MSGNGDSQLVQPGALCSAGSTLQGTASSLDEVTAVIASLEAGAAGIRDPQAAAAYEGMRRIWRSQLAALSEQTAGLGGALQGGSGCYVSTDEGVMGGGGLQQLFGPLIGPPVPHGSGR
jgi:hypothetical protein